MRIKEDVLNEIMKASKYVNENTYICPHCDWKIKHNVKIKLQRRKS